MKAPIYITGIGIISAIGDNVGQTLQHLKSSQTGVDAMKILPSQHSGHLPVAEVKCTNQELGYREVTRMLRGQYLHSIYPCLR